MNVRTITHGRYRTNTYLVDDGVSGEALLVDPTENPDGMIDFAAGAGLRVVAIVATHSHLDHIGGVAGVKHRLDVPFMIGREAVQSLREEAYRVRQDGIEIPEPPEPDRLLDEGEIIAIGTLRFLVLSTPGHWHGDISLYEATEKVVFTGDTLHRGEIGRYNRGCDEALLLQSIRDKLMTLPDEVTVLSGHGGLTTIGEERLANRGLQGLPRRI